MTFKSVSRGEAERMSSADRTANTMSTQSEIDLEAKKVADRILRARYLAAGVLINTELEIFHFCGSAGAYLEPPLGKANFNLLKMAREGLMLPLRSVIQKAKKNDTTVRKQGVRFSHNGEFRKVNLEVIPIKTHGGNDPCYLVIFDPLVPPMDHEAKPGQRRRKKVEDNQVKILQEELDATRGYLQSLVEQHQAADEELQTAIEEIQSSNEELQSINEELQKAKKELELSNENLVTLNHELNHRNIELSVLNDDLNNLFGSVNMPILIMGKDLRIRRFTPQAERVLSLTATDVGRPISDIKLKLNFPNLEESIAEVISTLTVKERDVQDMQGRWYSMRIRPYITLGNTIDGAVILLVDIDDLKNYSETIVETIREPLLVLDGNLAVRKANRSFYEIFKVSPEETQNQFIYDLGNRQWDLPRLRKLLEEILPHNSQFQDFEVEHEFERIGRRTMLLNARALRRKNSRAPLILLVIEDVTERKQTRELRESEDRYRTLFSVVPVGVVVCDREAKIQQYNLRAVEIWGREPELWIEQHCDAMNLFRPDGTPLSLRQNPVEKAIRTGITINNQELLIGRPDGSRVAVIANFWERTAGNHRRRHRL